MTKIEGAVALVTGGQRGLGKAFVDELLARGASKVYATARQPRASVDDRIVPLALEVTDPASVQALAMRAPDVTIVVNNAGSTLRGPISQARIEDVRTIFDVNLFGPLRVTQALAPTLAANGGGALVNIHSALSWAAGTGAYGASKAALWSMTNSLRIELASQGTQVLGVHLGYTDTDMTAALDVVKNDARQVTRDTLTALENGESEALVDDISRQLKVALAGPAEGLAVSLVNGVAVLSIP